MSFVWGEKNVDYLKKRHEALTSCNLFKGMKYTEDKTLLEEWIPLVMEGRDPGEKVAATRMDIGTDVNFGSLTRCMFDHLKKQPGVSLHFSHQVRDLEKDEGETMWRINVKVTIQYPI